MHFIHYISYGCENKSRLLNFNTKNKNEAAPDATINNKVKWKYVKRNELIEHTVSVIVCSRFIVIYSNVKVVTKKRKLSSTR